MKVTHNTDSLNFRATLTPLPYGNKKKGCKSDQ